MDLLQLRHEIKSTWNEVVVLRKTHELQQQQRIQEWAKGTRPAMETVIQTMAEIVQNMTESRKQQIAQFNKQVESGMPVDEEAFWQQLAQGDSDLELTKTKLEESKQLMYFPREHGYRYRTGSDGVYIGVESFWLEELSGDKYFEAHAASAKPLMPAYITVSIPKLRASIRVGGLEVKGEKGTKVPDIKLRGLTLSVEINIVIPVEFRPDSAAGSVNSHFTWQVMSSAATPNSMQFPHLKEALPRHEFQFKIVSMTKDQDGSIPVPKSVLKSIINWLVPPAVKKSVVESMPRELGYMLTRQSTQKVSVAASFDIRSVPLRVLDGEFMDASERAVEHMQVQHVTGMMDGDVEADKATGGRGHTGSGDGFKATSPRRGAPSAKRDISVSTIKHHLEPPSMQRVLQSEGGKEIQAALGCMLAGLRPAEAKVLVRAQQTAGMNPVLASLEDMLSWTRVHAAESNIWQSLIYMLQRLYDLQLAYELLEHVSFSSDSAGRAVSAAPTSRNPFRRPSSAKALENSLSPIVYISDGEYEPAAASILSKLSLTAADANGIARQVKARWHAARADLHHAFTCVRVVQQLPLVVDVKVQHIHVDLVVEELICMMYDVFRRQLDARRMSTKGLSSASKQALRHSSAAGRLDDGASGTSGRSRAARSRASAGQKSAASPAPAGLLAEAEELDEWFETSIAALASVPATLESVHTRLAGLVTGGPNGSIVINATDTNFRSALGLTVSQPIMNQLWPPVNYFTGLESSEDGTFSINIMLPPGAGDEEQGTVSKPEATFIAKAAPTSDDEDKVDDEAKKMRRSQLKLMRAQESFSRIADPSQDGTTQAAAKPEVGAAMAAAPDAPTPPVPPARGASRAPPQRPTGADGSETPQPAHGADGPTSMQPITGEFEVRASPSEALDTLFGLNLRRAWLGVRVDVQALMQAVEQAGAGALEHVDVLSAAFQPPKPVDTTTDRPDRLRSASSMSQAALSDVNDVRSFVSTVVTNVSPVARLWVEIERLRFATPTAAIGPPLRAFLNPPLPDIPALYSKEQAASNKKDKTSFDTTFTAVSALLSSYFNADRVGLRFAVGASLASISEAVARPSKSRVLQPPPKEVEHLTTPDPTDGLLRIALYSAVQLRSLKKLHSCGDPLPTTASDHVSVPAPTGSRHLIAAQSSEDLGDRLDSVELPATAEAVNRADAALHEVAAESMEDKSAVSSDKDSQERGETSTTGQKAKPAAPERQTEYPSTPPAAAPATKVSRDHQGATGEAKRQAFAASHEVLQSTTPPRTTPPLPPRGAPDVAAPASGSKPAASPDRTRRAPALALRADIRLFELVAQVAEISKIFDQASQ